MTEWHTDRPPRHGYYLGAWQRHGHWFVSELWFNPSSTGTGWWAGRGYLDPVLHSIPEPVPVEAWTPMPEYPEGDHAEPDIRPGTR